MKLLYGWWNPVGNDDVSSYDGEDDTLMSMGEIKRETTENPKE